MCGFTSGNVEVPSASLSVGAFAAGRRTVLQNTGELYEPPLISPADILSGESGGVFIRNTLDQCAGGCIWMVQSLNVNNMNKLKFNIRMIQNIFMYSHIRIKGLDLKISKFHLSDFVGYIYSFFSVWAKCFLQ